MSSVDLGAFRSTATPALCFDLPSIDTNIARAVRIAGNPERLWPHIKTYKTGRLVSRLQAAGIRRFKCATASELDLLGRSGVREALLAYPVTGPGIELLLDRISRFRRTRFSCLVEDADRLGAIAERVSVRSLELGIFIDVDCGQGRTGVDNAAEIARLSEAVRGYDGLSLRGLHVYDGHNHQRDLAERQQSVSRILGFVDEIRGAVRDGDGLEIIAGGTPTYQIFAGVEGCSLSPGTLFLHDSGYAGNFPDLPFTPAAWVVGRIVSLPGENTITIDVGTKSIATDPPGSRGTFPELGDVESIIHNEEHWVIRGPGAAGRKIGDLVRVVPTHICPTVNLYNRVHALNGSGELSLWTIDARDRHLPSFSPEPVV